MKVVVQYIGYFMAILGALTVVWRIAISFQKGEDRDSHTTQEIIEIREDMITRYEWKTFTDSIYVHNHRMRNSMEEIKTGLNSLRTSYVSYIKDQSSQNALTVDQFIRYMDGVEFELKKKPEKNSWQIPLQPSDYSIQYSLR
jgi:hypothetical protein